MHRLILLRLALLWLFVITLAGCGSPAPEPTPTPTKTPAAQSAQAPPPPPATPTTAVALATPTPEPPPPTVAPTPLPENIAPYTGLPVDDPQRLRLRPIFICVNNDAVGRTVHYGLSQADLVYEYIVDGFALTRITAMFHSRGAERIGPVRSARMPNIWMTYSYDGALACSGGSNEIRYKLKHEVGFPYLDADIDDPSNNVYFFSIGEDYRTRMQVSTDGVRRWLADTSNEKEWSRPGFEFSPEPPGSAAGVATNIYVSYPGGGDVEWRYDPATGGYIRYYGGAAEIDQGTGQPILAQNVIILTAEHELTNMVEDSNGTLGVDVKLYGFGDFRIFRDGQVYEGTWRADPENPPRWYGPGEVIIKLKPGQSWLQVVQQKEDFSYQ